METRDPRMEMSALGDFMLEEVLGRGGMGIVYLARRLSTGQPVALKLMIPELAGDEEFRERFVREGEFAPSLDHPNIVPVYEFGEVSGELYIAMQLIDGCDLKELIKTEGPLDPQRAVQIMRQAASALDAAHEMGVIHRDVKPQNILITPGSGEETDLAYVSDFGLIRPIVSQTSVSRTGQVFGSVPYMAPELIEGLPADGRADVYSLGCVIFEALTARVPYERDSEIAVVWAHIHEDPPKVSMRRTDVARGVDDVVIKALSKHPDDRYLTCGEMVDDLEAGLGRRLSRLSYAHMRPLVERIPRKKTEREVWAPNFFPELSRVRKASRDVPWKRLAAIFTALALLATLQFGREGGIPRAVTDAAEAAGSSGQAVLKEVFDRWNPTDRDDTTDISPTPTKRERTLRDEATSPWVPAVQEDERKAARAGDPEVRVGPASEQAAPDTSQILLGSAKIGSTNGYGLFTIDPRTRRTRLLFDSGLDDHDAAWSPDRQKIAFVSGNRLFVWDLRTGNMRPLSPQSGLARHPSWSPDGTKIAFSFVSGPVYFPQGDGWGIYVVDIDNPRSIYPVTPPVSEMDPTWSPDGKQIAFVSLRNDRDGDIFVAAPDGSGLRTLVGGAGDQRQPVWSPRGDALAFSGQHSTTSGFDIYVKRFSTGNTRRVTHLGRAFAPVFSPDGQELLFVGGYTSSNKQNQGLFLMKVPGKGGTVTRIERADHWDETPDWR